MSKLNLKFVWAIRAGVALAFEAVSGLQYAFRVAHKATGAGRPSPEPKKLSTDPDNGQIVLFLMRPPHRTKN